MEHSYTVDLQATQKAIDVLFHVLKTGDLYTTGGTTNPYADLMAESPGLVGTLMTLYCTIAGHGIESILDEEEMAAGEELDDEDSGDDEAQPEESQRAVPGKSRVAGKLGRVLRWFKGKMQSMIENGQWHPPFKRAPTSMEENEMLDMLSGQMQGMAGVNS